MSEVPLYEVRRGGATRTRDWIPAPLLRNAPYGRPSHIPAVHASPGKATYEVRRGGETRMTPSPRTYSMSIVRFVICRVWGFGV